MSPAIHLIPKTVPGHGPSEGRCLPCSGVSGRAIGDYKTRSQAKIVSLKSSPFACKANPSGHNRRNPDFSRQNRQAFSRNRNRQNDDQNTEEPELLSSKNGPLLSLSNSTPKFQATATPGPREKEIVELFRKVQAQLRERAAIKEEKKIEALQGHNKESETVDSLLKLLRKHSVEQVKRSGSASGSKDFILDQPDPSGSFDEEKSTNFFRDEAREPNASSISRPASNFQRKSPVPRVKFQPIYDAGEVLNSSGKRKKNPDETQPKLEPKPEPEAEPEPEPEQEHEIEPKSVFGNGHVFDEIVEVELSDNEEAYSSDEDVEEEEPYEERDLSSMKLMELRELAKSRGLKGISKLKKRELVELLRG